jgi:excinuclease UvrABC helicase subunit UvrB
VGSFQAAVIRIMETILMSDDFNLTCIGDVQPKPVDWIWQRRIARGHVSIIAGAPGAGKTQINLDIAARISAPTLRLARDKLKSGHKISKRSGGFQGHGNGTL